MNEDNFSFVTYKHDLTAYDIAYVERWVNGHLKQMAERTSGKYVECRSGIERVHFQRVYKDHVKRLKKL